jgi:DNA replication protein DnaC
MDINPKLKVKKIPSKPGPDLAERARSLGLYGLLASWTDVEKEEWIPTLIEIEEKERRRRSLERRMHNARIGHFRPLADFDWKWPTKVDRDQIEEAVRLDFLAEAANVILVGKNGVGKTMIAQNIAHQAVLAGKSVRVTTASELLCDLGSQESTAALMRRLRRYVNPQLLVVDEVGYLSSTAKHADLLFEVVTRRYQERRPIVLTTNKPFKEWGEVFPSAGCVVTLVDRLIHRSEIIHIDGESYRKHESDKRQQLRGKKKPPPPEPTGALVPRT